ncbi:MAG: lipopolysaccharide assembly protein LapA domain-containing protein [Solirubrobacterales bacterium]
MGPHKDREIPWRKWILAVLVALVVVVALQNSQQVSFEVLFVSFDAPMIVMLLIFALLGALIGWAAPVLIRHRRTERAARGAVDAKEIEKKR